MVMVRSMPVKPIAVMVGEHDTRIWRILHHYVDQSCEREDYSAVSTVGLDETSTRRSHNYVTLFVDFANSQVLFATEGKDASTVQRCHDDFAAHKR